MKTLEVILKASEYMHNPLCPSRSSLGLGSMVREDQKNGEDQTLFVLPHMISPQIFLVPGTCRDKWCHLILNIELSLAWLTHHCSHCSILGFSKHPSPPSTQRASKESCRCAFAHTELDKPCLSSEPHTLP